jgi:hypothetical protein
MMGTDIHLEVERRVDGKWEHVPWPMRKCDNCEGKGVEEFKINGTEICRWCKGKGEKPEPFYSTRNYYAFGVLCGVRDRVIPIAPPRGLPEDVSKGTSSKIPPDDGYDHGVFHSHSWVTVEELLNYNWNQSTWYGCTIGDVCQEFLRVLHEELSGIGQPKDVRLVFCFDC